MAQVKFERMHYAEWIHFKTETKRFPFDEAKAEWDAALAAASENEKKYNGPNRSVTIPMPQSDAFMAQNITEQTKEFNLATKKKKIGSEEEAQSLANACRQGHTGFNNDVFKGTGGETFARAASAGGTSIGAHGAGAFHEAAGAEGPAKSFTGEANAAAASTPKKVDKAKEFDVTTARLKVSQALQTQCETITAKLGKVLTETNKAKEDLRERIKDSGPLAVPFASKYADILTQRASFLQVVAPADEGKLAPSVPKSAALILAEKIQAVFIAAQKIHAGDDVVHRMMAQ